MTEVAIPMQVETKTVEEHVVATQSVAPEQTNGMEKTNGVTSNGNGSAIETVATNGIEKKEVELPKDPNVDPIGWLKQQQPAAVHKVNYHILKWTQQQAIDDEAKRQCLPGKNESVTRNQFLNFLRDGTVLAYLANKFAPGSVENVYENEAAKEKANQVSNIQGFINFAKEKAELPENQVFTIEDLQEKGKAGYEAVVHTLFQLGLKASDKFNQVGIDVQQIADDASKAVQNNLIQTIVKFFKRAAPSAADKQVVQQNGEKQNVTTETTNDVPSEVATTEVSTTNGLAKPVEEEANKKVEVISETTTVPATN